MNDIKPTQWQEYHDLCSRIFGHTTLDIISREALDAFLEEMPTPVINDEFHIEWHALSDD